jgi:hypothetical protein
MQVTVNVPDEFAAQAQEKGLSVEVYVEQMLSNRIEAPLDATQMARAREAVDRMAELRKGVRLGGLKIKDLINEGRKY